MAVDRRKLDAFLGQAVGDMGAAISAVLVHIGDKLGLYKAMAGAEPMTPAQLAERTSTAERYVREWLNNQAAGGYVTYHPESQTYSLSEEQASCLADEDSPCFLPGGYEGIASAFADEPKLSAAFRSGRGVAWHEHDPRLFRGTERFFRPAYHANLVNAWIPALQDMEPRLRAGCRVADIGCGHGASTILLAQAYPRSIFIGYDYHLASVERARRTAQEAGLDGRVRFEVASATEYAGGAYDLLTFFDCLHDMGDPIGAARHARERVKPDGAVMVVEPFAGDRVEQNLNPVGRVYYGFSTLVCTPASLSQPGGMALGAQAGEGRLRGIFLEAGFSRFRRAAQTPFNLVLEARP